MGRRLIVDAPHAALTVNMDISARGGSANGFELCGATQASCRRADAQIEGASVVLSNGGQATRVRYAWGESPVYSLHDAANLPAGPFEAPISNWNRVGPPRSSRRLARVVLVPCAAADGTYAITYGHFPDGQGHLRDHVRALP